MLYLISQLVEDPTMTAGTYTILRPSFVSNKIQVLKEVEAYPALSLVADVGGVLGLFIGFNFLMVWDGMVFSMTSLNHIIISKK